MRRMPGEEGDSEAARRGRRRRRRRRMGAAVAVSGSLRLVGGGWDYQSSSWEARW